MIITKLPFTFKRTSETWRKNYAQRNKVYESCNSVKPSVTIRKNAVKALGLTIATEITKSTIV